MPQTIPNANEKKKKRTKTENSTKPGPANSTTNASIVRVRHKTVENVTKTQPNHIVRPWNSTRGASDFNSSLKSFGTSALTVTYRFGLLDYEDLGTPQI